MGDSFIHIGNPRIRRTDVGRRLEAEITWSFDDIEDIWTLFFEVEETWGQYLTDTFSDPFVLALIELAMQKGCDIVFEAPMSEDLKYQLEIYLIPVLSRRLQSFSEIRLIGNTSRKIPPSEGAAGTGFSGGVDSYYTILKHIHSPYQSKRVTHVLLALNGAALMGISEELDAEWFAEEKRRLAPAARELGLEFVAVTSNMTTIENYKDHLRGGSVVPTSSFVHALRRLFGTYYWASAYEAHVLEFTTWDGGFMEPFTVPLVSVTGLRFYHSGCEVSRVEKVEAIADHALVQKTLTVCGSPDSCGSCSKCLRTMAELYSLGKLGLFSEVFDVEDYRRHLTSKLAREFASDHKPFTSDIRESFKKHGARMPLLVPFATQLVYRPYYYAKRRLRDNRLLKELYYNHGWAERMGEARPNAEIVQARFEGRGKAR